MQKEKKYRVIREFQTVLPAEVERVFPLLCPVREYDWIPYWRCKVMYSESGLAELGCVFQTDFEDRYGLETWTVTHYQPNEKISFVRTGEIRTTRYEIRLNPEDNVTNICWRQEITALTSKGVDLLTASSEDEFMSMMESINNMLAHYLKTGTMLSAR